MNRNFYLCHFSYELQAVTGNCSIPNNQNTNMYFMCWTSPLTVNHLKYKTTRLFEKQSLWLTSIRRQKLPVISIFFCINDVSPAMPQRYYTRLFLKPEEPHTSKQRESGTKLSSRIQFGVPRWPNQRNINRTEKCNPA